MSSVGMRTASPAAVWIQLSGAPAACSVKASWWATSGQACTSSPTTVAPADSTAAATAVGTTAPASAAAATAEAVASRRSPGGGGRGPAGAGAAGDGGSVQKTSSSASAVPTPIGTAEGKSSGTLTTSAARIPPVRPGSGSGELVDSHQAASGLGDRARERGVDREGVGQVGGRQPLGDRERDRQHQLRRPGGDDDAADDHPGRAAG